MNSNILKQIAAQIGTIKFWRCRVQELIWGIQNCECRCCTRSCSFTSSRGATRQRSLDAAESRDRVTRTVAKSSAGECSGQWSYESNSDYKQPYVGKLKLLICQTRWEEVSLPNIETQKFFEIWGEKIFGNKTSVHKKQNVKQSVFDVSGKTRTIFLTVGVTLQKQCIHTRCRVSRNSSAKILSHERRFFVIISTFPCTSQVKPMQEMSLFEKFITEGDEKTDDQAKEGATLHGGDMAQERRFMQHCNTQLALTVWWRNRCMRCGRSSPGDSKHKLKSWVNKHLGRHDMVRTVDRHGEAVIWCRKCSCYAQTGTEIDESMQAGENDSNTLLTLKCSVRKFAHFRSTAGIQAWTWTVWRWLFLNWKELICHSGSSNDCRSIASGGVLQEMKYCQHLLLNIPKANLESYIINML